MARRRSRRTPMIGATYSTSLPIPDHAGKEETRDLWPLAQDRRPDKYRREPPTHGFTASDHRRDPHHHRHRRAGRVAATRTCARRTAPTRCRASARHRTSTSATTKMASSSTAAPSKAPTPSRLCWARPGAGPSSMSELNPDDPLVNTATEYMYQMATIAYHTLHGEQNVVLTETVEWDGDGDGDGRGGRAGLLRRRVGPVHQRRGRRLQRRHLRGPGQRALLDAVQPRAPARRPGPRADLERHGPRTLRRARRGRGDGLAGAGRRRHRRGGPAHGTRLRRRRHPPHLGRRCCQEGRRAARRPPRPTHRRAAARTGQTKPPIARPAAFSCPGVGAWQVGTAGTAYIRRRFITPPAA